MMRNVVVNRYMCMGYVVFYNLKVFFYLGLGFGYVFGCVVGFD